MANPIIIDGKRVGKWKASFLLLKESWRYLKADKELLWVPVISTFLILFLSGLFIGIVALANPGANIFTPIEGESISWTQYIFVFGFYIISAFVVSISQATITHVVYVRAHGGDATLGQGLSKSFGLWLPLLVWSLLASTVGLILKIVSDRSQLVGKLVATLLGAAWSLMTYFVVPIMLIENKDAFSATKRSVSVFKATWGETLISNFTLGLAFLVFHLLAIVSFVGLMVVGATYKSFMVMIIAGAGLVVWLVVASLVQSVLQGVIKTLLYILASENTVPQNFNKELLENVFVRKDNHADLNQSSQSTI